MMKRILLVIPSTTYRTHDFMAAAGKLNAEIIVASDHRNSWANLIPDTTVTLNFRKPELIGEKVVEFARKKPFQAVVGVDDRSAYVAALAAEALSIPHNSAAAVNAARNKYLMRQKLVAAGLQSPRFELFPVKKNPAGFAKKVNYPCVLKPVFLSGSRGVTRANNPEEFKAAFQEIRELLTDHEVSAKSFGDETKQILVETYIPGVEVAVEGFLIKGEFKPLAIFDKPDPLEGPHFVETIYLTPSRLPGYVQREVFHAASRVARALGLKTGPIHAELRINDRGAWVVEIAARSIGGLCSRILRFDDGKTLEELILRQALSEDIRSLQREKKAAGVMMMPVPEEGVLRDITGLEAAKFVPGIEDILITIPREQKVSPMHKGGKYLGFIFARGDFPENVEASIRKAYRKLKINVENE
jgi:biotin carboxylase